MSTASERGSEWNKWDLHVHTPMSIIQNYGGDTEEVWEKYISDLESLPTEFKVLGINDYIFLDGYKKVLSYKNAGRLQNIKLLLPVIELRINKFASLEDKAWKKVNLHVIFSNKLTIDEIEAQFLNAIQHSIRVSPDIEDATFTGVATRDNLVELGKQIRATSTVEINFSDLKIGFWNINFDYKEVMEKVNGYFKGKCLTAVGKSEWDTMTWKASPAEKKHTINSASFSFISLSDPSHYQKHKDKLDEVMVKSFLLDCSDAHSFSEKTEEKDRIGNSFTWLKADLTFEGLKQVANDSSRTYVGDRPELLNRMFNHPTKFLTELKVDKVSGSNLPEKWFDGFQLAFNPSMVAIIGNKGQGKSAIADIIGLLGNTANYEEFSFLQKNKFRRKPNNKSERFVGTLYWLDGSSDTKNLSENPSPISVEKVKYLPQNFLEKLCNDDLRDFEGELRKVIFSHLDDQDRLGKSDLDELIAFKSEIIEKDIDELKGEIRNVNDKLVKLEFKATENYLKSVTLKLEERENEFKAHIVAKPAPIEAPTDEATLKRNEASLTRISELRGEIEILNSGIALNNESLSKTKLSIAEVEKTLQSFNSFEKTFEQFRIDVLPVFEKQGLNLESSISLTVNKVPLDDLLRRLNQDSIDQSLKLSNIEKSGLIDKRILLLEEVKGLQDKLDNETRLYQKYLDDQKSWEVRGAAVLGTPDKEGTIVYYKSQIKYLNEQLHLDIESTLRIRTQLLQSLFNKKQEIIELYKNLFKPVTDFITEYGELLSEYNIRLDVDFKINALAEKFFDHVSMGNKGSFIGNPTGADRLNHILENSNLKSSEGIVTFLDSIMQHLHFDMREDQNQLRREVESQLKKGYTVSDLYSFLFELEYLSPEYKLKLGEKNLVELSPGERGALLLIFYLTIDQSDIPLVIDQPEENLDNQSIYKVLVQFIKKAKEKRQIIIVTHNPNLAVACNAEQIVHVSMDKENGNRINIISGALENPLTNDAVIDVLEGTFPALNTRNSTYKIIER